MQSYRKRFGLEHREGDLCVAFFVAGDRLKKLEKKLPSAENRRQTDDISFHWHQLVPFIACCFLVPQATGSLATLHTWPCLVTATGITLCMLDLKTPTYSCLLNGSFVRFDSIALELDFRSPASCDHDPQVYKVSRTVVRQFKS